MKSPHSWIICIFNCPPCEQCDCPCCQSHCTQIILGPTCLCDLCCPSHWASAAIAAPESLLQKPQFTWPSFTKGQQQRDWWFSYTSERSQQPSVMGNSRISPLNMKKNHILRFNMIQGRMKLSAIKWRRRRRSITCFLVIPQPVKQGATAHRKCLGETGKHCSQGWKTHWKQPLMMAANTEPTRRLPRQDFPNRWHQAISTMGKETLRKFRENLDEKKNLKH